MLVDFTDATQWQEVVEPTTEALAIPAPEACPENEGDGYVLPTDEDVSASHIVRPPNRQTDIA